MIQWFPGHMAKAKREIRERLRLVDVVYELLDARIPAASRNPLLGDLLKNKPRLVLLMKADLADPSQSQLWKRAFEKEGAMALEVDAAGGFRREEIIRSTLEILKPKLEKARERGLRARALRAMVVGIPNVGKSTLINRLARRKATRVADRPGVTRAQQWIRISGELELLDTPGVLWPKFDDEATGMHLALTGAIRDEILESERLGEYLLDFLKKHYPERLAERYGVGLEWGNAEIVEKIARDRGFFQSDQAEKAYDALLTDFRKNRLGRITLDRFNGEEK
ncbi:MAG: ribosome biogenesis GTPase YlqF [Bacilli bacterium]|jgi:ribosome biogenesis GTPase A